MPNRNPKFASLKWLIILLVIMLSISAISVVSIFKLKSKATTELCKYKSEESIHIYNSFFTPITSSLSTIKEWGETGVLDPSDAKKTNSLLAPIMKYVVPRSYSIVMADGSGKYYGLTKAANGSNKLIKTTRADSYDPRKTPWFIKAYKEKNTSKSYWSGVYEFSLDGKPAVAASSYFECAANGKGYVVAIQLLHDSFYKAMKNIIATKHSLVFLVDKNRVIEFIRHGNNFVAANMNRGISSKAILLWRKGNGEPVTFEYAGQRWVAHLQNLGNASSKIQMLSVMNEFDLMMESRWLWIYFALGTIANIAILIAVTVLTIRLYKNHTLRQRSLSGHIEDSQDELLEAIELGESDRLEFKSTLRWHIKANKPMKEIELSALKTIVAYMNTDGGTLLIGVEDDGSILGIDTDNFANNDKFLLHFNNLIKQHIGLIFSQYIHFAIKEMEDGKSILVVDCIRSSYPAFLKVDNNDDFYIRVGPGSRKLSTSKAIEYINSKEYKRRNNPLLRWLNGSKIATDTQ